MLFLYYRKYLQKVDLCQWSKAVLAKLVTQTFKLCPQWCACISLPCGNVWMSTVSVCATVGFYAFLFWAGFSAMQVSLLAEPCAESVYDVCQIKYGHTLPSSVCLVWSECNWGWHLNLDCSHHVCVYVCLHSTVYKSWTTPLHCIVALRKYTWNKANRHVLWPHFFRNTVIFKNNSSGFFKGIKSAKTLAAFCSILYQDD